MTTPEQFPDMRIAYILSLAEQHGQNPVLIAWHNVDECLRWLVQRRGSGETALALAERLQRLRGEIIPHSPN